MSIKALWGNIGTNNRPDDTNGLLSFPVLDDGTPMSYTLERKPYLEGSVGIANIFRVVRVDVVRRFTYTEHPYVSKIGVRVRIKMEF
jgi:hypothetical protein